MEVIVSRKAIVEIEAMETYAKKAFGLEVKLAEMFNLSAIPELLVQVDWTSVLPVFFPAKFDNRQAVNSLVTAGRKKPYEEVDVMQYTGSAGSEKARLLLVENSPRPSPDTMGQSPDSLVKSGGLWLPIPGYAIAQGLRYQLTHDYLDPETWTWFPNERLPDGGSACGDWRPGSGDVWFSWGGSAGEYDDAGARLAIKVPSNL